MASFRDENCDSIAKTGTVAQGGKRAWQKATSPGTSHCRLKPFARSSSCSWLPDLGRRPPKGGGQRRSAAVYAFIRKARFPSINHGNHGNPHSGTRKRKRIHSRPLGTLHSRNCRGTCSSTLPPFRFPPFHFHPASAAEPAFASPSTSSRKLRRGPPPFGSRRRPMSVATLGACGISVCLPGSALDPLAQLCRFLLYQFSSRKEATLAQ